MTKELTEQQQKYREKRDKLKKISQQAKEIIESKVLEMTVNQFVIEHFYKDEINTEFKTLHQWSSLGFKVKKGSVSFAVWGKPKERQKEETNKQEAAAEEEEKDDFYPLCYLFSNAQVEERK